MDTGSIAFYAGGSPASAPFRVGTNGNLTATNATLTGAITASSLSITGTASFAGGSMTLPNGGSITSSTVDLNQGTLSGLTVDGNIDIGGTGKIRFNSNNSYIDSSHLVLRTGGVYDDAIRIEDSTGTSRVSIYGDSSIQYMKFGSAGPYIWSTSSLIGLQSTAGSGLQAMNTGGVLIRGQLYPGYSSNGNQTSIYIQTDSLATQLESNTGHINLTAIAARTPSNSSSVAAWMELKINGTAYSVPLYS